MEQAVSVALARNRDAIAARLNIRAAELDKIAAELYPNPVMSYSVGNLTLGAGNSGNARNGAPAHPGLSQTVQTIGISEIIDVWSKRGARMRAADRGLELKRLEVADALREIVHAVRSAFADVLREQSEKQLSHDMRDRHAETVRLSRARFNAGEISEAECRKIELEGLKYQSDVVDADSQYDLARQKLAALLGLGSSSQLPEPLVPDDSLEDGLSLPALIQTALQNRPDARAVERERAFAEASLGSARRDALPDISLGAWYTHSEFLASGDNPNTFGLSVSLPLPVFDRNQANIGRAELEIRRAANNAERIQIVVRQEVADAARRVARAKTLLGIFEGGGMLDRADSALRVAETSYKAGAISLLELLEAQRTFLETRAQYLRAQYDHRQARVDLRHVVGRDMK
jgi:cobalt-zinc-cadmium efflux system outer membrane protein